MTDDHGALTVKLIRARRGWAVSAVVLGLALQALVGCGRESAAPSVNVERKQMGTRFRIHALGGERQALAAAVAAAFAELDRIEPLLSEWRDDSEISLVNRDAGGEPVSIGPELLEVVVRAAEISRLTEGAFDISFAGCGRLWSFRRGRRPSPEALEACLPFVDFAAVEIDLEASTLRLAEPKMRIGIAGIGKGYGVDRAAAVLDRAGVVDYLIDGGGDIRVGGRNEGRVWSIGIADPRRSGELHSRVALDRGAIVTSGDYQLFFERDGVREHHILDPRTAEPSRASIAVTVIASDATTADALATGLFVMGPERGLSLVETLDGVEALIFGPEGVAHRSSGFPAATD